MTFEQLRRKLATEGYRLVMEDKSLIDETQVYAIYRGENRLMRYRTLGGVELWWKGL